MEPNIPPGYEAMTKVEVYFVIRSPIFEKNAF